MGWWICAASLDDPAWLALGLDQWLEDLVAKARNKNAFSDPNTRETACQELIEATVSEWAGC